MNKVDLKNYFFAKGILFIFILAFSSSGLFSQKTYEGDEKIARQLFIGGDYVNALKEYELLLLKDSANPQYRYAISLCYLHTYYNRKKALPILEEIVTRSDFDVEAFYQLGLAYMYEYRFDDAIKAFQDFRKKSGGADPNFIPADRQIEMCNNAIELIKNPVNVGFENLGSRINSPYPDFNPYINRNESIMFYTSKRNGNLGNLIDYDGYYTADVFTADNKYGIWEKARRLSSTINTPLVEETSGMSSDGNYLFVFIDNLEARFQTRMAVKQGKSFQKLLPMGTNVNPNNKGANAIAITPDKKTIFFSSSIEGGKGGSDIFMSKMLPSGLWGPPENIGSTVNTKYDEDYPWLAADGKTLYFASTGHNSMGGFDIFKTVWDQSSNTWSDPENLGYPVNTPDENTVISFTASGRYAYMAAFRDDTYGNLDIYRLTFFDIQPAYTIVKCSFVNQDSANLYNDFTKKIDALIDSMSVINDTAYLTLHGINDSVLTILKDDLNKVIEKKNLGPDVSVMVYHAKSGKAIGKYRPNKLNGSFIVALGPGEFTMDAFFEGYEKLTEHIKIEDRETSVKEIQLLLKPVPIAQ